VAVLTRFSTPFYPAPQFYTGTGTTALVPFIYPVAINGRGYVIDTKSNQFTTQFDARVRDSVDQSDEPGEGALNPQGLWRRSQSSWHLGAGQTKSDTVDAEPFRFNTSKGVNPWVRGQVTMLKDVTEVLADTTANLKSIVVGSRLYVGTGGNIKFTTDLVNFTNCTSEPAGDMNSMTTDGFNVFVSFAAQGVWITNTGTGAFTQLVTGTDTFTTIKYTKGRLMMAKGPTMYNFIGLTPAGPGAGLFTHANTDWSWVGFAGGQNAIYAAGFSGTTSLIYRTAILADGSTLAAPIVAAELPNGEIVSSLDSYLGFILIGTTTGFRFASADVNGNLEVGPLVTVGAVAAFASQGKHVWFSYKNFDATSTGLGRMDISNQVATNQPAYSSDLMVTGQGAIPSVSMFGARPVFTVTGKGVYVEHATNLVATATLDSGGYRWGIADVKFIPKWDLRTSSLLGTVLLSASLDGGAFNEVGTHSTAASLASTFNGPETRLYEAEARLTLTRASGSITGPTVTRWMARAYAAPFVSQIFSVPVLLYSKLRTRQGEVYVDVDTERALLRDLKVNPRIITYQDNMDAYSVIVEDVRWQANSVDQTPNEHSWNGTMTVIMRSVG